MTKEEFEKSMFKLVAFMKVPKNAGAQKERVDQFSELYSALRGCSAIEFEKMTAKVQATAKFFNNLTPADFWRARSGCARRRSRNSNTRWSCSTR